MVAVQAVIANAIVVGILGYAALLLALAPDFYYRSVQEDEYLEWATFWAFLLAAVGHAALAVRSRRAGERLPWFPLAVALFCGFVAMEEISWGQRLLGTRPPAYFLEHNFQQELNVHNVVGDALRQAAFLAVIFGYGAALPLAFCLRPVRDRGRSLGVVAPSPLLIPAFAVTGIAYAIYPWTHTGEWTELMLAAGMGFAALIGSSAPGPGSAPQHGRAAASMFAASGLVIVLGVGTAVLWSRQQRGRPERLEAARIELAALQSDFARARTRTRCGIHKRVYAFVEKYGQRQLRGGAFPRLVAGGLPEERAAFFLDPWNSPYWIRHVCSDDRSRRAIYVYSFGPNRRRDSGSWELADDDLGAWISRPEPE